MRRILIFILGFILLLVAAFFAGLLVQRLDQREITELRQTVGQIELRNRQLQETLDIVKRQIQTDRIAYEALQQVVEDSAAKQQALSSRLEQARAVLRQLQERAALPE